MTFLGSQNAFLGDVGPFIKGLLKAFNWRPHNKDLVLREVNAPKVGAEIWEGDEHRKFQFLESGDSRNGRNLFSELPFL